MLRRDAVTLVGLTLYTVAAAVTSATGLDAVGSRDQVLDTTLRQIADRQVHILDLTYPLDDHSPFWPGENYQPFQLRTIATLEKNGVASKEFSMPEHFGTHLDAPCHFEKGQITVDEIDVGDLMAPGVVIDSTVAAEADPDYRLTVRDILDWERTHGQIPSRAVVFMNTGWARFWSSNDRYRNQDGQGKMHFPGFSEEAARWLVNERNIRGIGIDTLSIDHGPSKDFIVHHVINGAGRYGLENVANLKQLPPQDFFLIVAPIKIAKGTGGPTRLLAIVRNQKEKT